MLFILGAARQKRIEFILVYKSDLKWLPTYGERLTCAGIYRPSYRHMAGTMYIGESVANYVTPCVD